MPICVHCNGLAPYVYTVYSSKDNVRLAVCDQCHLFADPLIEHPLVLLLIDLILLKPRVYRHLVFNRGSQPYRAGRKTSTGHTDARARSEEVDVGGTERDDEAVDEETRVMAVNHDRRDVTWRSIFLLAAVTMSVETLVLYSTMSPSTYNAETLHSPAREKHLWAYSGIIALLSTVAQHLTSTVISAGFLKLWNPLWLQSPQQKLEDLAARRILQPKRDLKSVQHAQTTDGRGLYFTLPMISLTLFFSSLLPCLLHACLFIWSANVTGEEHHVERVGRSQEQGTPNSKLVSLLTTQLSALATQISPIITQELRLAWHSLSSIMQREGIDEMWIVVRLLAGMSSGFGLRVVLPGPPWRASVAVLGGWLVKTAIQTGLYAYLMV